MSKHQSNISLPFNKANFYVLEQERNMLKITLDFLSTENQKLKSQVEDMKITVRHNKEQLEEYVTKITNKELENKEAAENIDEGLEKEETEDNKSENTEEDSKYVLFPSQSWLP